MVAPDLKLIDLALLVILEVGHVFLQLLDLGGVCGADSLQGCAGALELGGGGFVGGGSGCEGA